MCHRCVIAEILTPESHSSVLPSFDNVSSVGFGVALDFIINHHLKAGGNCCKLPSKATEEEKQEATATL